MKFLSLQTKAKYRCPSLLQLFQPEENPKMLEFLKNHGSIFICDLTNENVSFRFFLHPRKLNLIKPPLPFLR
jgi:hypothetical protein